MRSCGKWAGDNDRVVQVGRVDVFLHLEGGEKNMS